MAILVLIPLAAQGAVYKCSDASGKTVYQESPCTANSGTELDIQTSPAAPAASGLRETERQALERIENRAEPAQRNEASATVPSALASCPGIAIQSMSPFAKKSAVEVITNAEGISVIAVIKDRCARVALSVDEHYYGRLRESLAEDLTTRIYGAFENDRRYFAETVKLAGPDRVGARAEYAAQVCFGAYDYDLLEVGCW